jgi:uracil-DNA glycosylase family 4
MNEFEILNKKITGCHKCKRLRRWCKKVAKEKVRRFRDQPYYGKPLTGFGDPSARLLIVGLAPAAHGGNRTGRMFTGDGSAYWLMESLWKAGFANQPTSTSRTDGLKLTDCYITAVGRCAPPLNKLLPEEIKNCQPYLLKELELLQNVKVIVGLGKVGFDNIVNTLKKWNGTSLSKKPKFGHGVKYDLNGGLILLGAYHPSQQNTFTGRLSKKMMDEVFMHARKLIRSHANTFS